MRALALIAALTLSACGPGIDYGFNGPDDPRRALIAGEETYGKERGPRVIYGSAVDRD